MPSAPECVIGAMFKILWEMNYSKVSSVPAIGTLLPLIDTDRHQSFDQRPFGAGASLSVPCSRTTLTLVTNRVLLQYKFHSRFFLLYHPRNDLMHH
jgi:hypothetical protein